MFSGLLEKRLKKEAKDTKKELKRSVQKRIREQWASKGEDKRKGCEWKGFVGVTYMVPTETYREKNEVNTFRWEDN